MRRRLVGSCLMRSLVLLRRRGGLGIFPVMGVRLRQIRLWNGAGRGHGDALDGWGVCSVQLRKLDPFGAKWTDRLSLIIIDWEMGAMLHVSGRGPRKSETGVYGVMGHKSRSISLQTNANGIETTPVHPAPPNAAMRTPCEIYL
jgi:hypothetical protein